MVVAGRRPALRIASTAGLALLLLLAWALAVSPPPAAAQTAEECLETTALLPALWRKLVDSIAAVTASVASADEQQRLGALRVLVVDLLVAKRRLSTDLGAFLDAPSEPAWAKVSNRLPSLIESMRDMVTQLRKEGTAGGRLAAEPVFKDLRSIVETRKTDVICRLRGPAPPREAHSQLAALKAKLDEEIAAMNAADEALVTALVAMRKAKP